MKFRLLTQIGMYIKVCNLNKITLLFNDVSYKLIDIFSNLSNIF